MKNVLIYLPAPVVEAIPIRYAMSLCKGRSKAVIVWKRFFCETRPFTCTGCGVCSQYKKPCPQKDDAAEIIGKMLAADVIVMLRRSISMP